MSTYKHIEASVFAAMPFALDLGTLLTVLSIVWVLVRLAQEPMVQKFMAQFAALVPTLEAFTSLAQRLAAVAAFWRKPPDAGPPKNG